MIFDFWKKKMIERMIFGKNDFICIAAQNVASLNLKIHSEGFSEIFCGERQLCKIR